VRAGRAPRTCLLCGNAARRHARRWDEAKYGLVVEGNWLKFSHPAAAAALLATGDKEIAEGSPLDYVWGTGVVTEVTVAEGEARSFEYVGTNLLGKALMDVRRRLRDGAGDGSKESAGGAGCA